MSREEAAARTRQRWRLDDYPRAAAALARRTGVGDGSDSAIRALVELLEDALGQTERVDEHLGALVLAFIEANPLPPEVAAIITREGIETEVVRQLSTALPGVVIIAHGVPARMLDDDEMRRCGWVRNPECKP